MPFLIGLLSPVFTQRMSPFNSLLLPLATAQPVLMRHRGHQVDKGEPQNSEKIVR